MEVLVVLLGLLAALFFAVSDFLEQRAASAANTGGDRERTGPASSSTKARLVAAGRTARRVFRRLLHDRRWLVGWCAGTLAYLIQAVALHLGSVGVVQALQVTTLLFALPLSSVGRPERPGPRDAAAGLAVTGGLILFLLGRGAAPPAAAADRSRILLFLLLLGAVVMAVAIVAALHGSRGPVRALLLGAAAGAAFAASATLVKLTTGDLATVGVPGTARDWPGYSLALATGAGLVLQQLAFASGRLATATTAIVLANPTVGSVVSLIGFGERLPDSGQRLVAMAGGATAVLVGVALLARSPLLRGNEAAADAVDDYADDGRKAPALRRRNARAEVG